MLDFRRGIVPMVNKGIVDIKQDALIAQSLQLGVIDGKNIGHIR